MNIHDDATNGRSFRRRVLTALLDPRNSIDDLARARSNSRMLQVQRLGPDDWQLWRAVRLEALAESPDAFGSTLRYWQGDGDTESRWRSRLEDVPFNVVARLDGAPVGQSSGTAVDDRGGVELISMWVAPSTRGRSVGSALIDAVIEWAEEQHASKLQLTVRRRNVHTVSVVRTCWLRFRRRACPAERATHDQASVPRPSSAVGRDARPIGWLVARRPLTGSALSRASHPVIVMLGGCPSASRHRLAGDCPHSQRRRAPIRRGCIPGSCQPGAGVAGAECRETLDPVAPGRSGCGRRGASALASRSTSIRLRRGVHRHGRSSPCPRPVRLLASERLASSARLPHPSSPRSPRRE